MCLIAAAVFRPVVGRGAARDLHVELLAPDAAILVNLFPYPAAVLNATS